MGVDAIVEKLTSLPFQSINHNLSTQDAQPSNAQGGILVMVTGSLRVDDGPNLLNYCQTFQLIPDTNGSYYVQNDVFRLNYG
ncbi:nuclear transport factor 2 [Calocera cornea HHB12733]|uniref:Nuclear transport factor 2 n=1 Tax=Calocera cornea HHB12733 TaxID=1353952 RepID=A0A165DBI1_9BASI|nr:nuclear transport factor 2 [Calocera cornea HHB12733]